MEQENIVIHTSRKHVAWIVGTTLTALATAVGVVLTVVLSAVGHLRADLVEQRMEFNAGLAENRAAIANNTAKLVDFAEKLGEINGTLRAHSHKDAVVTTSDAGGASSDALSTATEGTEVSYVAGSAIELSDGAVDSR